MTEAFCEFLTLAPRGMGVIVLFCLAFVVGTLVAVGSGNFPTGVVFSIVFLAFAVIGLLVC